METCTCGAQHHASANYYVSVVRDHKFDDARLLYGPFAAHAAALANVRIANNKACDVDPRAHWYSFGTVAMAADYTKPGILNHLLPVIEEAKVAA